MKFTTEGRITVSVKPMPGSLPGMEMLQLSVQDTGCGIPREKQKLVFDAFGQVRWHLGPYLICGAAVAASATPSPHADLQMLPVHYTI